MESPPKPPVPTVGVPLCIRPSNEVQYQLCGKYIWWNAHRVARILKTQPEDVVGTVWLMFQKYLDGYRPDEAEFTSYFTRYIVTMVVRDFLRNESMSMSLYYRTNKEREACRFEANYHEESYFYHYRPPDKDEDWIEAVLELFDYDKDALWEHMTRPLDKRAKFVITQRYRYGEKLFTVGKRLKVSKERVRQIQNRAIDRMRGQTSKLDAVMRLFGVWDGKRASDD